MSARGIRGLWRQRGLAALVVLWVSILALGFAAQTTELFGSGGGTVSWLLLAAAALVFMSTGVLGVRIIQRALDRDEMSGNTESSRDERAGGTDPHGSERPPDALPGAGTG